MPTEVKVHLREEAHMIEDEHDRDETGEAHEEKRSLSFVAGKEVELLVKEV